MDCQKSIKERSLELLDFILGVKSLIKIGMSKRPLINIDDELANSQASLLAPAQTLSMPDLDIDPLDAFLADMLGNEVNANSKHSHASRLGTVFVEQNKSSTALGSNYITAEDIQKNYMLPREEENSKSAGGPEVDDEREERERIAFLEALKSHTSASNRLPNQNHRKSNNSNKVDELGIIYRDDGDIVDEQFEYEKSALEMLEDHKRGKELKPIDHSSVNYLPFRKNLYIVPRTLAKLSDLELQLTRDELDIKVRGIGCPAPVQSWDQCGLSERILLVLEHAQLKTPYAIQRQAIPAIMAGRDIIGVAKTGSGKTLAFLLPMFRHVLDQPPLQPNDGPIAIIMAPARELAFQIHNEAKRFTKALNLRIACIYGGSGVAEQIGELKRQPHIVVCTPGRMIDILCMHAGRLLSLRRVTMVVMDEADRMFDMGFEPQIRMIMQNIRPDRQTILFSATFPKQIEKLAKAVLTMPLEIQIGERSTVNPDITQIVEVHEEPDKFLRLLQLLGIWYEKGNVLIFVDKQEKCDQLFADLLRAGYPCLSLHGGKDQVDREHTLREFKTLVKTVMVATGVAGRGLDVPEIKCVVNYNCPNHLEDYVHRVGRTGRAGRKGTAYTFISKAEEAYAPIMVKVLSLVNNPIPAELQELCESFKNKVRAGQAKWTNSGFEGKGFTFDASEMNEAQKQSSQQKRAYEIEQGLEVNADVEANDDELEAGPESGSGSAKAPSSAKDKSADTAGTKLGPYSQVLQAALSIFRSKATHPVRSVLPNNSRLYLSAPVIKADGTLDAKAALARSKVFGAEILEERSRNKTLELLGLQQQGGEAYYQEILDINDYPPQARAKVTQAGKGVDRVMEMMGVNVVSKGAYRPPGKKVDDANPGLQLVIEGSSSMQVKKARAEIVRMLDQEVLALGFSVSGQPVQGRYSVLAIANG